MSACDAVDGSRHRHRGAKLRLLLRNQALGAVAPPVWLEASRRPLGAPDHLSAPDGPSVVPTSSRKRSLVQDLANSLI